MDVTGVRWDGEHTAILQCRDCSVACQAEPVDAAASGTELAAETEPASRIEATAPGKPEDDTGECFELSAPLLVASDGARRTIAEAMQAEDASRRWVMPGSRFRIRKYADTSVRCVCNFRASLISCVPHARSRRLITHSRAPLTQRVQDYLSCQPSL